MKERCELKEIKKSLKEIRQQLKELRAEINESNAINSNKETLQDILKLDIEFRENFLSRLVADCKFYISRKSGQESDLWAGGIDKQISYMRALWESFIKKPIWISLEDIQEYENKMKEATNKSKNTYEVKKKLIKNSGDMQGKIIGYEVACNETGQVLRIDTAKAYELAKNNLMSNVTVYNSKGKENLRGHNGFSFKNLEVVNIL